MSGVKNRKHYRVARKEIENSPNSNASKCKKKKCAALTVCLAAVTLILGVIVGYCIGRNEQI